MITMLSRAVSSVRAVPRSSSFPSTYRLPAFDHQRKVRPLPNQASILHRYSTASPAGSAREDKLKIVRRFYNDLWNKFDTSVADSIISPTVTFRGTLEDKTQDREGFKQYVRNIEAAFPDFFAEIGGIWVDGDDCIARIKWFGTHDGDFRGIPATGKAFAYEGVGIFKIVEGRIVDCWVVGDTQKIWQAIGK